MWLFVLSGRVVKICTLLGANYCTYNEKGTGLGTVNPAVEKPLAGMTLSLFLGEFYFG